MMSRIKLRLLVAICWTIELTVGISFAYAQNAQTIAKKTLTSTVLLVMEDRNGQPLSLGSGFFVRKDEIATNLHVIEGAASGYIKLVGEKRKYDIDGITAIDAGLDLVVLKVSAAHSHVLSLGNSETVQVGDSVYVVGNPEGLEGTFSQGIVSSIRNIGKEKLLQITAPISPGSSGGPVLSAKGEVVGVSVATFRGGQNLNFAIPSNYLKTLLAKTGHVKPLAQRRTKKSRQSILSDLGGRSTESVVGTAFAWTDNWFMGYYTFSVRNKLRVSVRNVVCLIIFYGRDGLPIETEITIIRGPIGGKLAKRSDQLGRLEADQVRNLTAGIEIRVLDFQLAE